MRLFSFASSLLVLAATTVLAAPSPARADSNQDTPCLSACNKWSQVLDSCYQIFTKSPHTHGYEYSNQFLACLCRGTLSTREYGNDTMIQATSICQSCSSTPSIIKHDLSRFLTLCQVQATNGTSANATSFAPLGYNTPQGQDAASPVAKSMAASASANAVNLALASVALMLGCATALW